MADKERDVQSLAKALAAEFDHWDFIHEYGSSDPTWADGMNLNLTRNHIIAYKRDIEALVKGQQQELTLFPTSYPEIYYRETPPELPYEFMARADEIRSHAREQLSLYEQNPDYRYIREHFAEAFPEDGTKTIRDRGIHAGQFSYVLQYQNVIERDDLVGMRSRFCRPYEEMAERFAESTTLLREYLSRNLAPEMKEAQPVSAQKPSLDNQIQSAQSRVPEYQTPKHAKEKQLTLF